MAPIVADALAGVRQQDLRREAEQWRVARLAHPRTSSRTQPGRVAAATALAAGLAARVLRPRNGRGAVLMLAARRVPAGRAVGADVWRRRDQSGDSRAAAERNAVAEGVRGRVELVDADARDLPFAPASSGLVVSSLAISNIREAGGRAQALREAVRVLRPGGRLRIVDQGADRFAAVLREAGCAGVAVRPLDWRTWYGMPGHHLTLAAAAQLPGLRPSAMAGQGKRRPAASRRRLRSPGHPRRPGHDRHQTQAYEHSQQIQQPHFRRIVNHALSLLGAAATRTRTRRYARRANATPPPLRPTELDLLRRQDRLSAFTRAD
jgi:SAM-dependent methyltransferase